MSIDKCIMDVMPICALLYGQTECILEKYYILAQSEVATLVQKLALKC